MKIPSCVFDKLNEAIVLFEKSGKLIYPEKREECPNCYMDTLGTRNRSISLYKPGGPYPFDRGMPCPYCGGKGYKGVEQTEIIQLRIYWDRKSWVNVDFAANIPDGSIQTITDMSNLDKINKANYLIPLDNGIENYDASRFQKLGQSMPTGFKQNPTKYAITFWTRANE